MFLLFSDWNLDAPGQPMTLRSLAHIMGRPGCRTQVPCVPERALINDESLHNAFLGKAEHNE